MCEKLPVFSVVMAVYNGEKFIGETINCIINQTFVDWEYVIINDGSTDSTSEILADYAKKDKRIRVITNEKNLRLQASLNRGLDAARGRYIVRIDADDLCTPDRLEKQYRFMEGNPDIAVSYCRNFVLIGDKFRIGVNGRRCEPEAIKQMLAFYNPVLHPAVVMKSEAAKKYRYSTEYTCSEDLELWTRIAADGLKIACQREYLVLYRMHENQITATAAPEKEMREIAGIEKEYYKKMFGGIPDEKLKTLVESVYMRQCKDIDEVLGYFAWFKKENQKSNAFTPKAVAYAFMEWGVTNKHKLGLATGLKLLRLGGLRMIYEFAVRKLRSRQDIKKAAAQAAKLEMEKYVFER